FARPQLLLPQLNPPCFACLLPRPPSSILFPYTTLFRSCFLKFPILHDHTVLSFLVPIAIFYLHWLAPVDLVLNQVNELEFLIFSDRKSTRLNSSHVSISYAVFCLIKRRQTHNL